MTVELLKENQFSFKKKFGQNFIFDTNFLNSIVSNAGITKNDEVLEIGTGAGTLTKALANSAKKVVSFEIDKLLEPIIKENTKEIDNVEIVFADALKTSMNEIESKFEGPFKVVANLPYYITTALIMKLLEESSRVESICIMVQKEVAQRLCAKNNTENYGAITVAVEYYGNAKIIKNVSRKMFKPVPNVDSAIVQIDIQNNKFDCDKALFFKIVKSAFARRRKTLINNLQSDLEIDKQSILASFENLKIDKNIRGEALSSKEFCMLANSLQNITNIK